MKPNPPVKNRRRLYAIIGLVVISAFLASWLMSGPKIHGTLPREDWKAIKNLIDQKQSESGLLLALRPGNSDALANWMSKARDGRILFVDVEQPNRVLVFVTTSVQDKGRLYVTEKGTNGWWVSKTNHSVTFRPHKR